MAEFITIEASVHAPQEKVWNEYTNPEAIKVWNQASTDWHTIRAENDVRIGGRFLSRMEAKDGSAGFDFTGTYDDVIVNERIAYTMDDGRKVTILFTPEGEGTHVTVSFMPENENALDMQRSGWQAILESFKQYVEKAA